VIQFPETAQAEWEVAAGAIEAEHTLRRRIQRDTAVEQETERLLVRHEAKLIFDQSVSAEDTTLEMLTLANYKSNPALAPVDVIEGVMKENGTCLVIGQSTSGKSTLALQMLNSLATGEDWLGQSVKPVMGSTGIMSYDMDASMLLDWMSGFPNIDPSKVSVVNAFKRGNPLAVPQMRAQIVAAWQAINTEVVMIDSFGASFFGSDQNDAAMTTSHYRDLIKFALTEVGAKVLIVIVHATEGSPHKARGSSVHHDVADTIVSVEGTGLDPRKVSVVKYRAALGQVMMSPVMITAPDPATHLVEIDTGEMTMQGMHLPPSVAAAAFEDVPEAQQEADTTSSDYEDDDL
jgi:KaiC/GvpD/RAD55 family RecA-like ATPase